MEPLVFSGNCCVGKSAEEILRKLHDGIELWVIPKLKEAVDLHEVGVQSAWLPVELARNYLQGAVDSIDNWSGEKWRKQ